MQSPSPEERGEAVRCRGNEVSERHTTPAAALILQTTWQARWWIAWLAFFGAMIGLAVTLTSNRVYRAEAVVMPVSNRQRAQLDGLAGGLGELALASLGVQGDPAARLPAATLEGKEFTARFIRDKGLLPILFPAQWDKTRNRWRDAPPTDLEALRRFDRGGIRKIIEDRRTGFVTIQIDWKDPAEAVDWVVSMIAQVNSELRGKAIAESRRTVQYLTEQADRTQSVSVKEAVYRLIETEMKRLTFAEAEEEYALKFVDRPITPGPKDYIWPRPVLTLAIGALVGALLGLLAQRSVNRFGRGSGSPDFGPRSSLRTQSGPDSR